MPTKIGVRLLDSALAALAAEADTIYICYAEPSNFTQASSTYKLGTKAGIIPTGPIDASPNGRKVVYGSFIDGSVSATGTVTYIAICDTDTARLLATKDVPSKQVYSGNSFSMSQFDVRFPAF